MDPARLRGLLMVFAAGVLYSTAGLFMRALPYDGWTILAWRGVFGALFCLGFLAIRHGLGFWRSFVFDRVQWLTMPLIIAGGMFYLFALKITTVADVMVIYATLPFVTAAIAWVWGREVPSSRMLVASLLALIGVAVMMVGGFGSGNRIAGAVLTLAMNLAFGITIVGARRRPGSNTGLFTVGTTLCALISFGLAPAEHVDLSGMVLLALFGISTIGLAMLLFMAGARLIPPPEVGLVGITDVVIGPLLVWIGFGEAPGTAASIGGAIVIAALLWHLWPEISLARRAVLSKG